MSCSENGWDLNTEFCREKCLESPTTDQAATCWLNFALLQVIWHEKGKDLPLFYKVLLLVFPCAPCLWIHSFTVATWVDFGKGGSLYYVWDNWAYPNKNSSYTFLKCFTRGRGIWRREKGWFRPEKCSSTACSQLNVWWAASNWKEGNKIIILP